MIDINNLSNIETEIEELDLIADSENYLQDLSEQEEINIKGGREVNEGIVTYLN